MPAKVEGFIIPVLAGGISAAVQVVQNAGHLDPVTLKAAGLAFLTTALATAVALFRMPPGTPKN